LRLRLIDNPLQIRTILCEFPRLAGKIADSACHARHIVHRGNVM